MKYFVVLLFCCFVVLSPAMAANEPKQLESRGIIPLPTGDCGIENACNPTTHFCKDGLTECEYSLSDFAGLFVRLAQFMLGLVGAVALAFFVYGGFIWIFSGGSPDKIAKGKKILGGALIGLLLSLGAWVIVNFVIALLTGTPFEQVKLFGREWWKIKR